MAEVAAQRVGDPEARGDDLDVFEASAVGRADLVEKAGVLPVVARTFLLLAERDRLALVGDLAEAFSQRLLDLRNVVRATVTTAEP